jgi:hypothetical protein
MVSIFPFEYGENPVTPAQATGRNAGASPVRQDGAVEDHVSPPRTSFDPTELRSIVSLCFGSDDIPELTTWMTQLDDLLSNKLGAVRFSDLRILRGETVINMIDPVSHSK